MKIIDQASGDNWVAYHGDCVEVLPGIPSNSVHLTVSSPPFASLYTYSASDRDMGNSRTHEEFHRHLSFLMPELFRVTKPGRNCALHCMDMPTSKVRDGKIGLRDFPGELIRAAEAAGWIWHSRITIWKDPVTAMQRTKALGLLHKQIKKDSCMSRQGIPDYVLVFRKPGDNDGRVTHTDADLPVQLWQKYASPVWMDIDPTDTLNGRSAREEDDERHICPLQLEVIRRCLHLWSNPGDTLLDPFGGIGSTGYVALQNGRRSLSVELKASYFKQLAGNLSIAAQGSQVSLFAAGQ